MGKKTYLIKSLDNQPITKLTGVNLLRVEVDGGIRVTPKYEPLIMMYDRKQIVNKVVSPGIFMYIDKIEGNVLTDGNSRKFEFEEV